MSGYSDITKAAQTGTKAGYKPQLIFMKNADVLTWVRPLAVTAGDSVTIATAHTLVAAKSVKKWDAKMFSVTLVSDPVGDPGALSLIHKLTVVVTGDNAEFYEQILAMLNDDITVFVKDADCIANGWYIQLGDDCNPVALSPKFDGKKNDPTGGQKEWTLEITAAVKFFYKANALPAPAGS